MSAPKWAVGMERVETGVYQDSEGILHIDRRAVCESLGMPYTKKAHDVLTAVIREKLRQQFPDYKMIDLADDD